MTTLQEQAANLFALTLSDAQAAAFDLYTQILQEWNQQINLTAITAPDEVRVRHYLDSLSIAHSIPMQKDMRIIDVGTGAGFPGLALALAFPQVHVTLLESTGKKIKFLDQVIQETGLSNVTTCHARAEEAGQDKTHRAHYDLVLARAVARMPALVEYMLPLARVGGRCMAMKGITAYEETQDAQRAIQLLGGRLARIDEVRLPDVPDAHYLVIIDKTDATPAPYPRKPGIPTREPILP